MTLALQRPDMARLHLYLALSRTPHGVLDLAAPYLTATLALGRPPDLFVSVIGILTMFAGYTAVYAVNDIVDHPVDAKNVLGLKAQEGGGYLDAVFIRHPLAQGFLTRSQALAWAGVWSLLAVIGAYVLNPWCVALLAAGVVLEAVYCKLLKITHHRALINGVVKTLGPLAGVLAVNPNPSPWLLLLVFAWFFTWEIGGQNIPADWFDMELDTSQGARTIPVVLGPDKAARLAFACLCLTAALSVPALAASPLPLPWWTWPSLAALETALILHPAWLLKRDQTARRAGTLFNRASWRPMALLGLVIAIWIFG